jgi:uncharacterized coiled-coil protein SlyX
MVEEEEDSSKTAAFAERAGEGVAAGASSSSSSSSNRGVEEDTNKRRRLNEDSVEATQVTAKEKLAEMMVTMHSVSEEAAQDILMLLESKDAVIAKLEAAVAKQDAAIAKLEAAVAKQDAAIAKLEAAIAKQDAAIAKKDATIASDQITFEAQSEQLWKKDKLIRLYEENNILMEQCRSFFDLNVAFKQYDESIGIIVASWYCKHSDQDQTGCQLEREITDLTQPFRGRIIDNFKNTNHPKFVYDKQEDEDQGLWVAADPSDENDEYDDIMDDCLESTLKYLSNKFRRSFRPTMEPMAFQEQKFLYLEVAKRIFYATLKADLFPGARMVWSQLLIDIIENTKLTMVANYAVVTVHNPDLVLPPPQGSLPKLKIIHRNEPVADSSLQQFYDAFDEYLEGMEKEDIFGEDLMFADMAGKGDFFGEFIPYDCLSDLDHGSNWWRVGDKQLGVLLCRLQPYLAHIATIVKPGFESQLYILKKMVLHVTLDYLKLDPVEHAKELACIMTCHEKFMIYGRQSGDDTDSNSDSDSDSDMDDSDSEDD